MHTICVYTDDGELVGKLQSIIKPVAGSWIEMGKVWETPTRGTYLGNNSQGTSAEPTHDFNAPSLSFGPGRFSNDTSSTAHLPFTTVNNNTKHNRRARLKLDATPSETRL